MKSLKINMERLCRAMEDSSYEHEYYLDLKSGEIFCLSEYMDAQERENLKDRLIQEYDRYERIPRSETDEDYDDMEEFTKTVKDEHLASLLEMALTGEKALGIFNDVLANYPQERKRWFYFRDNKVKKRALAWLKDMGIRLIEE